MHQCSIYLDGTFRGSTSGAFFTSVDPYTAAPWAEVPRCTADDVALAIDSSTRAFRSSAWRGLTPTRRGALLRRIGDLFAAKADYLAEMETRDNGKPLRDTLKQLRYLPEWFYYYGGLADKVGGNVIPMDQAGVFNYTQYEPVGVVAAITSWNSPLMLATWKLAPALAAGNTVILKPSEHASVSTCEFMKVLAEAELPRGVVNLVTGFPNDLGNGLIEDPRVSKVTFTGSTAVGKTIGATTGGLIKPSTLELGGKSAQIVLEDASISEAVDSVAAGIFGANGQSCVACSRLLIHESIEARFLDELISKTRALRMGNPMEDETRLGPMANEAQYHRVLGFIDAGIACGATRLIGGSRARIAGSPEGYFIEPTIFTDVDPEMSIVKEEIFGPVLVVMTFDSDAGALALSNSVNYGLATGVWTRDIARAHRLIDGLESGTVYVNMYKNVSFTSPAGGYKQSGIGRENGIEALLEFFQLKSVWINTTG